MRGRNRKWFETRGGVREIVWIDNISKFITWILQGGQSRDKWSRRTRRGLIDGEKRVVRGELFAHFVLWGFQDPSDMLDHLVVGPGGI